VTDNNSDSGEKRLEQEVEALLFASDSPLSAGRISLITGKQENKAITEAVKSLNRFYRDNMRSYEIVEVAGGYQLTTLPEFSQIVSILFKSRRKAKLSQAALETLAIVAYKQPVNRIDIEAIRGVNCDGVLSTLLEREFITITGRGQGVGRPFLYSTTRRFLEYMGLKNYKELPNLEEFEKNVELQDIVKRPSLAEEGTDEDERSRMQPEGSSVGSGKEVVDSRVEDEVVDQD